MKPGQGKNKGSGFEREVGAKLSKWITGDARSDLFCRTVLSGGQFTSQQKGNPGDLMAQDPLAFDFCSKFVVECKFWRDLQMLHFLSSKGELFNAMVKVRMEAITSGKMGWWLVAKQNHQESLLLTHHRVIDSSLRVSTVHPKCHVLFTGLVDLFYLDNFLHVVDPIPYITSVEGLSV